MHCKTIMAAKKAKKALSESYWPPEATIILIEEYFKKEEAIKGAHGGKGRGKDVTRKAWLEIVDILTARGYPKSKKQIQGKIKNLRQAIQKKQDGKKLTGGGPPEDPTPAEKLWMAKTGTRAEHVGVPGGIDLLADEELSDSAEDSEEEPQEICVPVFDAVTGEPLCSLNLIESIPQNAVGLTYEEGPADAPPTFYVINSSDAGGNGTSVIDLPWSICDGNVTYHQPSEMLGASPSTSQLFGTGVTPSTSQLCDTGVTPSTSQLCGTASSSGLTAGKIPRQRMVGLQKPATKRRKTVVQVVATPEPNRALTPAATHAVTPPTPTGAQTVAQTSRSARQSLPYTEGRSGRQIRFSDNKKKTELYCQALKAETSHWDRMVDIDELEVQLKNEQLQLFKQDSELKRLKIKQLKRELGEE